MNCPSCLRAQQIATHRDFRSGCIGCEVRELALMDEKQRRSALQLLLVTCGQEAYERVRRDALYEVARIIKLRRRT